ncbi:MAG: hypothetical protein M3340_06440 [Actinomycetota bacterium]|nr:hypothetical protein [Actinomycetota bacterium]
MARSAKQREAIDASQRTPTATSVEESRDVARWLSEEIAPELPNARQRELARESAARFEDRAARAATD